LGCGDAKLPVIVGAARNRRDSLSDLVHQGNIVRIGGRCFFGQDFLERGVSHQDFLFLWEKKELIPSRDRSGPAAARQQAQADEENHESRGDFEAVS
jgi:hypothetical protein